MKAIVSLSGGIDSATVLADLLSRGYEVETVGFTYGSKHNTYENDMAVALAEHYGVPFTLINLEQVMSDFKSALLLSGGPIPEGHYEDESMSQTVVPGRNMIFISILAGLAESREADLVAVGIHSGDHAIYPDCRPRFFSFMKEAVEAATDNKVSLTAPFLDKDKAAVIRWGIQLGVPYHLTRTCYKCQPVACGKCGSCVERLESFAANNYTDPLEYQKQR